MKRWRGVTSSSWISMPEPSNKYGNARWTRRPFITSTAAGSFITRDGRLQFKRRFTKPRLEHFTCIDVAAPYRRNVGAYSSYRRLAFGTYLGGQEPTGGAGG